MIGLMVVGLFADHVHSLKEKRQLANSIKERVRQRYNVAVSETGTSDKWQTLRLSIVSVSNSQSLLGRVFQEVEGFLASNYGIPITQVEIKYW
jgi:hypothetical protein